MELYHSFKNENGYDIGTYQIFSFISSYDLNSTLIELTKEEREHGFTVKKL